MKKILSLSFCFLILFSVIPAVSVQAATGIAQLAGCSGVDCSACNVVDMANGVITWLIGILFIIFGVLMAIAGVKLVTSGGNHHALDEAKSSFMNAIIGFIIILSAWLVVDTIMRGLVGTSSNPGQIRAEGTVTGWLFWSEVQCQTQTDSKYNEVTQEDVEFIPIDSNLSNTPGWTYVPSGGSGGGGGDSSGTTHTAPCTRLPGPASEVSQYNCSSQQARCTAAGGQSTIIRSGSVLSCLVPPGASGGGGSNCGVNESTLVNIPGQGGRQATAATANRFVTIQRQLVASGVNVSVTSSYRSDARQTELWDQCPRCQSQGTVARPCSRGGNGSAHTSGLALDMSSSGNRCDIIRACRSAAASFIMTYRSSGHVHCDWRGGGRRESLTISCP